jgi:hypothetical protein
VETHNAALQNDLGGAGGKQVISACRHAICVYDDNKMVCNDHWRHIKGCLGGPAETTQHQHGAVIDRQRQKALGLIVIYQAVKANHVRAGARHLIAGRLHHAFRCCGLRRLDGRKIVVVRDKKRHRGQHRQHNQGGADRGGAKQGTTDIQGVSNGKANLPDTLSRPGRPVQALVEVKAPASERIMAD